jgi:RNA 3'-terminal phosphate cyclase (ATP)
MTKKNRAHIHGDLTQDTEQVDVGAGRAAAAGVLAAERLLIQLKSGCAVDEYLADQLVAFMALASGWSSIFVARLSMHTRTAIHFAEKLTGVRFDVVCDTVDQSPACPSQPCTGYLIMCEGIGFVRG